MSGGRNARNATSIMNRGPTSGGSVSGAKAGNPSLV
jgi:hypothetical protein